SLAASVSGSGLAAWVGTQLEGLQGVPPTVHVLTIAVLIIFLAELTSNLASSAAFLPVVQALAATLVAPPLLLTIPTVLAASFAFMLPVATPPNAIVFGSGYLTVPQMAKVGVWLNLVGIVVIVGMLYLLLTPVFGV